MHIFVSSVLIELFSDSKANDFPSEADSIDGRSSGKNFLLFCHFWFNFKKPIRIFGHCLQRSVFCSKQTNH